MYIGLSTAITAALNFSYFSPRSLFTGSDQGVWYDLDDDMDAKIAWVAANGTGGFLTAFPDHVLFQDSVGSTPVTGVGQTLGLVLDKSKGMALGSEMLAIPYSGAASGLWTVTAAGVQRNSSTTGQASVSNIGNVTYSASKTYLVTFTVSNFSGDSFTLSLGGGANVGQLTGNGNYSFRMRGGGVSSNLQFIPWAGTAGTADITTLSVKELAGNHRTQATTANKPLWGARKNLLTQTEDVSVSPWSNQVLGTGIAPAITADAGTDPLGGNTADRIQFDNGGGTTTTDLTRRRQDSVALAGASVTTSVWLRSFDGVSTYNMQYVDANGNASNIVVTGSWQRLSNALVTVGAGVSFGIGLRGGQVPANSNTADILIWGAQLEYGSTATTYQRVTTATDYDAIGFPKFATYDGVNDSMATASIDFTATDTMTVSAGIAKLSDAAQGMIIEHTASLAANNGSFYLSAPNSAAANYAFASKGTVSATDIETGFTSPNKAVLTGISDISADSSLLRINGVAGTAVTTDQGTGNFSNAVLNFGSRSGGTLPFNGQENQTLVINKILTAPQLAQLESFINSKTGAY